MAEKKKSRFRLFAGPNGSGKSELFKYLREKKYIHTELYVSADRIEKDINENGKFVFNAYRVSTDKKDFFDFVENHGLWQLVNLNKVSDLLSYQHGIITVKKKHLNSYVASFIASYLVLKLCGSGQSFCFETVMSHESKINLLSKVKMYGYRMYLYFVFTKNPDLNIERIKLRVKEGGHDVPEDKVKERFNRSLRLLPRALQKVNMGYLIDNTDNNFSIIAQKKDKIEWKDGSIDIFLKDYLTRDLI